MALTKGLLLDTHTWFWLANRELALKPALVALLEDALAKDRLFVCSISLLELANAERRSRLESSVDLSVWIERALRRPGPRILEITPAIALETMRLPADFHGDPGDRLIAATARVHALTLLTHDRLLLQFAKSGALKAYKVSQGVTKA